MCQFSNEVLCFVYTWSIKLNIFIRTEYRVLYSLYEKVSKDLFCEQTVNIVNVYALAFGIDKIQFNITQMYMNTRKYSQYIHII